MYASTESLHPHTQTQTWCQPAVANRDRLCVCVFGGGSEKERRNKRAGENERVENTGSG